MTKLKFLGAASILAAMVATPLMAQESMLEEPGPYGLIHPQGYYYQGYYYNDGYAYRYRDPGFWPGEVAAGVVGGAIGMAGAIASAPFRGRDSYAYYPDRRGVRGYRDRTTCGPQLGATYMGPDGRWYPC